MTTTSTLPEVLRLGELANIREAINALPRLLSIAEAYANAPIVHDVTGRHGFIGHHVRIVPCDAGGEPTTGGRGE